MGLFSSLFKGKKKASSKKEKRTPVVDLEKMNRISEYIKGGNQKDVIKISLCDDEPTLACSKFGGVPYWDINMEYPKNKKGEPLYMLAQINFEEACIENDLFPKNGLLQFFVEANDLYGLSFDDNTKQEGFRIVYHEKVNYELCISDIEKQGIKDFGSCDLTTDLVPIVNSKKLKFEEGKEYISFTDKEFDTILIKAIKELFNEDVINTYRYLGSDNYTYLCDTFISGGHKMLGYPFFTQADPRDEDDSHNTLLLQIDSDIKNICWGDCGVCNFFINDEKLKALDFSDVIYNWDCY